MEYSHWNLNSFLMHMRGEHIITWKRENIFASLTPKHPLPKTPIVGIQRNYIISIWVQIKYNLIFLSTNQDEQNNGVL